MYIFADAMEKNTTLTKIDLQQLIPVIIEKKQFIIFYSIGTQ